MTVQPAALRTLAIVIRTGSFAAAGRELGYTASAVSQQMSGLERSLGLQLFEREARRVSATPAAHHLSAHAEELVGLLDKVENVVSQLAAGQVGRLRIGSFASAGAELLSSAIARFLVRRREVRISLDEGEPHELFPRVVVGELDVAIGFTYDLVPMTWPGELSLTPIMTEPVHVVANSNHRLAAKPSITFGDLSGERWVANREDTAAHKCLYVLGAQAGFRPSVDFRTNSFEAVRGLVGAGLGVALVPDLAFPAHSDLVRLPLSNEMPRRHIVGAQRARDRGPLGAAFLASLQHVSAQLTEGSDPT